MLAPPLGQRQVKPNAHGAAELRRRLREFPELERMPRRNGPAAHIAPQMRSLIRYTNDADATRNQKTQEENPCAPLGGYGTEASAGVIQIITKEGRAGPRRFVSR